MLVEPEIPADTPPPQMGDVMNLLNCSLYFSRRRQDQPELSRLEQRDAERVKRDGSDVRGGVGRFRGGESSGVGGGGEDAGCSGRFVFCLLFGRDPGDVPDGLIRLIEMVFDHDVTLSNDTVVFVER